jgi:hypothetical protein
MYFGPSGASWQIVRDTLMNFGQELFENTTYTSDRPGPPGRPSVTPRWTSDRNYAKCTYLLRTVWRKVKYHLALCADRLFSYVDRPSVEDQSNLKVLGLVKWISVHMDHPEARSNHPRQTLSDIWWLIWYDYSRWYSRCKENGPHPIWLNDFGVWWST